MDSIIGFLGSAGFPTSFVGIVLFLYFTLRKQEASVRAEQIATIERLRTDIKELSVDKDQLSDQVDNLRKQNGEQLQELARLKAKLVAFETKTETKD